LVETSNLPPGILAKPRLPHLWPDDPDAVPVRFLGVGQPTVEKKAEKKAALILKTLFEGPTSKTTKKNPCRRKFWESA